MKKYLFNFLILVNFCVVCSLLSQIIPINSNSNVNSSTSIQPIITPNSSFNQATLPINSNNLNQKLNLNSNLPIRAESILNFWFGSFINAETLPLDKIALWTGRSLEISKQVQDNFKSDLQLAAQGKLNSWRDHSQARLALIILLDQITRHIYQNRPQAYNLDGMAKAIVLEGIQKGDDLKLYPIEKAFFYLPLQHAEDHAIQELSVKLYQQLVLNSPEPVKAQMQEFLNYAQFNQQIIARFGRFPHRNIILGRVSTPLEEQFLNNSKIIGVDLK